MQSKPDILVVGAGYVGLSTAVFLAVKGYPVVVAEKNQAVLETLQKGCLHFREEGLAKHLKSVVKRGRVTFVPSTREAYASADMIFVAIDSVERATWTMRRKQFERLADWIGTEKRRKSPTVILKSTNILGFARRFRELLDRSPFGQSVRLLVNPEFLREGHAYNDTVRPQRIVIGARSKRDAGALLKLYQSIYPKRIPIIQTDWTSAELIKLASNVYLAYRLAFIHEIADYARLAGVDLAAVREGIGYDARIGHDYFEPGLGFGGSCLPKDCRLINSNENTDRFTFETALGALAINDRLLVMLTEKLKQQLRTLTNKKIAILGAAFKPEVDDTRGSRSVDLAKLLRQAGARVVIFEPYLCDSDRLTVEDMPLAPDMDSALRGASAVVIGTAHQQFRSLKPGSVAGLVKRHLVVDYFQILRRPAWEQAGFTVL